MKSIRYTLALALAASSLHADWPQWGGRNERNFISDEKGLPVKIKLRKKKKCLLL
jgi:hypothetical protein